VNVSGLNIKEIIKKQIHKHKSKRFIELDMVRGLAILLMVFGHVLWDLDYFGIIPMNNWIYSMLQQTVPPLFFLLVGIGLVVSKKKIENKSPEKQNLFFKILFKRGLKVIGIGMLLTLFSLLFLPETPVIFGVLHCIGTSIILSIPFLKYKEYSLLVGVVILLIETELAKINFSNPSIFHLIIGMQPAEVWKYTVDYFPLMPWFGICLLGIVIGDILYCGDERGFRMPNIEKYKPVKLFSWAGQHSLAIYLIHQPIIAGTISIFVLL